MMQRAVLILSLSLMISGCPMVGPDFEKPQGTLTESWMDQADPRLKGKKDDLAQWWKSFNDPILTKLIEIAYAENLSLRSTGIKILSARAQLGIAIGNIFPQEQKVDGLVWDLHLPKSGLSERLPGSNNEVTGLWYDRLGPTVNWEIDLWGKFRRAIESADASMLLRLQITTPCWLV